MTLLSRRLTRVGIMLLLVRLPGTLLALVLHPDVTFDSFPIEPTPAGQYLLKDALLFTAALVIGSDLVPWAKRQGVQVGSLRAPS